MVSHTIISFEDSMYIIWYIITIHYIQQHCFSHFIKKYSVRILLPLSVITKINVGKEIMSKLIP